MQLYRNIDTRFYELRRHVLGVPIQKRRFDIGFSLSVFHFRRTSTRARIFVIDFLRIHAIHYSIYHIGPDTNICL